MNTRPPYFIGIALPPELNERLLSLKRKLHEEMDHTLKPLEPHITLLHPSSLRDIPPAELLPRIRRVAAPYLPLTLSFETVEAFERTVLYIRVRSPELESLQLRLVDLLPREVQRTYHRRPYTPHVTLVQARAPHALDIEILRQRTSQAIDLPCQMTAFSIACFTQKRPRDYRAVTI